MHSQRSLGQGWNAIFLDISLYVRLPQTFTISSDMFRYVAHCWNICLFQFRAGPHRQFMFFVDAPKIEYQCLQGRSAMVDLCNVRSAKGQRPMENGKCIKITNVLSCLAGDGLLCCIYSVRYAFCSVH